MFLFGTVVFFDLCILYHQVDLYQNTTIGPDITILRLCPGLGYPFYLYSEWILPVYCSKRRKLYPPVWWAG